MGDTNCKNTTRNQIFQVDCLYDNITIENTESRSNSEGSVERGPPPLCGRYLDPYSYAMKSNTAKITFQTDQDVRGDGFELKWESVDASQCAESEITVLEAKLTEAALESVNFPMSYLNNLKCRTSVSAAEPTNRVLLTFNNFSLSEKGLNCSDNLLISLDPAASNTSYSQRLCSWNNSDINRLRFLSAGNKSELLFTTDDLYNAKGYSISYKAGEIF